jgi:hypothetical protein
VLIIVAFWSLVLLIAYRAAKTLDKPW